MEQSLITAKKETGQARSPGGLWADGLEKGLVEGSPASIPSDAPSTLPWASASPYYRELGGTGQRSPWGIWTLDAGILRAWSRAPGGTPWDRLPQHGSQGLRPEVSQTPPEVAVVLRVRRGSWRGLAGRAGSSRRGPAWVQEVPSEQLGVCTSQGTCGPSQAHSCRTDSLGLRGSHTCSPQCEPAEPATRTWGCPLPPAHCGCACAPDPAEAAD